MSNRLFDSVQCQYDLVNMLLSSDQLLNVNVKSFRKMILESELDYRKMLVTPRNGKSGSAIIVAQPTAAATRPNVTGPVLDWTFPVVCLEQPKMSMNKLTGTLLEAEPLAAIVMDLCQVHADELYGEFTVDKAAMKPDDEFVFKGVVGYRVNVKVIGRAVQTPRTAAVSITDSAGQAVTSSSHPADVFTLTCATPGAQIWFTTDGSFPSRDIAGNSASQLYQSTLVVASGTVVRAAAYATGRNSSAVRYLLAT